MKTHLFITGLVILWSICSCNQSEKKSERVDISQIEEITIDPKNGIQLPVDSFIRKVEYIKLETTDNNLIGKISQLLFADSLLIVVDSENSNSICVFDWEGRFKYKIGSVGSGPAEYVNITNVTIVPGKDQLSVLDGPQKKVIYYKLTGEYEYSEQTPFMMRTFEFLESGFKVFNTSSMKDPAVGKYKENVLVVTDFQNEIIYGACHDFYSDQFQFCIHKPLRKFEKAIYFSPSFTDTIFLVTDTGAIAKYYINITWNGKPKLDHNITNEILDEYLAKNFYFNGDYVELKDLTFMNIATSTGNPFIIYSHKTKKTYLNSGNVSNPFYAFLNLNLPIARYQDNIIVSDVQSHHILASKKNLYQTTGFQKSLDALYKELTEDSNPVLFFFHLNTDL